MYSDQLEISAIDFRQLFGEDPYAVNVSRDFPMPSASAAREKDVIHTSCHEQYPFREFPTAGACLTH
jgi:hypothetical protein